MKVVGHSSTIRRMREIDVFTLDLGRAKMPPGSDEKKVKTVDPFSKKYEATHGRQVQIFGNIGFIKFYVDVEHDPGKLSVYSGDNVYEVDIQWPPDLPVKSYVIGILKDIDDHETTQREVAQSFLRDDGLWLDDRNGRKYTVNQRLPRDKYKEELKRRSAAREQAKKQSYI